MNTPIKREDIREGDRVRKTIAQVVEFTAALDYMGPAHESETYELIERPVQLPDVPGYYLVHDNEGRRVIELLNSPREWVDNSDSHYLQMGYLNECASFTLLRPVAEVAAEVLAEVERNSRCDYDKRDNSITIFADQFRAIAAKWAAK